MGALLKWSGSPYRLADLERAGEPATVHELAEAVAAALAEGYGPRDPLSDLARLVRDIETRMGVLGL